MATQQSNDELNLRRKAHRRLVGAVALTLAAVVILPMILDREPKPGAQDIDLRIPSVDKAGEFVPGVPTPVDEGNDVAAVTATVPVSAVSAAAPVKEEPSPAEEVKAAVPVNEPVSANEQPVTAQPAAGTMAVQVGAYSSADTAQQELLKLKKWGFKAYTEKSGDNYRVRIGPYTDRDKVDTVRRLLENHGLQSVVVTVH